MPSCVIPLKVTPVALALAALLASPAAQAQAPNAAWQRCAAISDSAARLTCFDQWAGQQAWQAPGASAAQEVPPAAPSLVDTTLPATRMIEVAQTAGLPRPAIQRPLALLGAGDRQQTAAPSASAATGRITASVVTANSVNRQPTSSAPEHIRRRQSIPYRQHRGTAATLRAHQDRPGFVHPKPPHAQGFAVVWLHPAVVLAGVLARKFRALSARPTMSPR
jgi:hypothetical protein